MDLSEYWTKENKRIQKYSTHAGLHIHAYNMFLAVCTSVYIFDWNLKNWILFDFDPYQLEYSHDWSIIYVRVNYKHDSTMSYYGLIINSFHSDVTSLQKLTISPQKCIFSSCICIQSSSSIDHINICISSTMHVHYIDMFCHQSALVSITRKKFEFFPDFSNWCHVINRSRIQTNNSVMYNTRVVVHEYMLVYSCTLQLTAVHAIEFEGTLILSKTVF
jgi:hypothetical protein